MTERNEDAHKTSDGPADLTKEFEAELRSISITVDILPAR
jgi:hypothetical protein